MINLLFIIIIFIFFASGFSLGLIFLDSRIKSVGIFSVLFLLISAVLWYWLLFGSYLTVSLERQTLSSPVALSNQENFVVRFSWLTKNDN